MTAFGAFLYLFVAALLAVISFAVLDNVRLREDNSRMMSVLAKYEDELAWSVGREVQLWTASMVLSMVVASHHDHDGDAVAHVYNMLYFHGVPKDVLDDPERMYDFLDGCMCDEFEVRDGKSPFKFEFVRRERNAESAAGGTGERSGRNG